MGIGNAALTLLAEAGKAPSTDIWSALGEASAIAIAVLVILLLGFVLTIGLVAAKYLQLSRATTENRQFLNLFWNEKIVEDAYAKSERFTKSPIAAIFKSGAREIKKITASRGDASSWNVDEHGLANVSRSLARTSNNEVASLEKFLPWLATLGSASPFIGLFGTVFGIINSFQKIAAEGNASLATVAPGISEALVATAAGLFVAIPAVIAYNSFANRIKRQAIDMDGFSQDFLNIVQRGSISGQG